jgi:hypothetical protein
MTHAQTCDALIMSLPMILGTPFDVITSDDIITPAECCSS